MCTIYSFMILAILKVIIYIYIYITHFFLYARRLTVLHGKSLKVPAVKINFIAVDLESECDRRDLQKKNSN